jgi:hypothetical protein
MRYMLLIYDEEPPADAAEPTAQEMEAILAPWYAYDRALQDAGVYGGGEALQPTATATTLRMKGDERVVTDGPFAETREVLGGYYLIDVPDLDAALDWAARCPAVREGAAVEVRAIMDFGPSPQETRA